MGAGQSCSQPRSQEGATPPRASPHSIRWPVNIHFWDDISFLHWPVAPEDTARLLPKELTVLTHGGKAWVSVTPFCMRVRLPGMPFVPPRWTFPETNVRTYVVGPDGREGLWFLRMEVTAIWFVATLRTLGLPYFRNRMGGEVRNDRASYSSQPHPWSSGGGHRIVLSVGERLRPPEGGPWDRFVTARWGAFHRRGPLLLYTPVEHRPWNLYHARIETCSVDGLIDAAGLPALTGPPRAHFSPGVRVRVGLPNVVTHTG
ncbi:MAG: DUF2071 domain-containing protein [Actinomycetota bacterium]|nr:DUF2071 domain-containing protein [Actinomycetota bacterium]